MRYPHCCCRRVRRQCLDVGTPPKQEVSCKRACEECLRSDVMRFLLLIWILIQIPEVFSIFSRHPSVTVMSSAQYLSANK